MTPKLPTNPETDTHMRRAFALINAGEPVAEFMADFNRAVASLDNLDATYLDIKAREHVEATAPRPSTASRF